MVVRPTVPWFDEEIAAAKRKRRQLERKWLQTNLTIDRDIFKAQRQFVVHTIRPAKFKHYNEKINKCDGDQGTLFRVICNLMNTTKTKALPTHGSERDLATRFSDFFISKVATIRQSIETQLRSSPVWTQPATPPSVTSMSTFAPTTVEEITKLIRNSSTKSSPHHSVEGRNGCSGTNHHKHCQLATGQWSGAVFIQTGSGVAPYQEASLDAEELANYRPVSNLSFISKVLEKVVGSRRTKYLDDNDCMPSMQSAYGAHHSVETVLLRVHYDVMRAVDRKEAVVLTLLDLSAVFDTIDHRILLDSLEHDVGICGVCLQ